MRRAELGSCGQNHMLQSAVPLFPVSRGPSSWYGAIWVGNFTLLHCFFHECLALTPAVFFLFSSTLLLLRLSC